MNTIEPTGDFLGLALVVVLLGVRHGLDADHLAAIDGMTRYNAQSRPGLARRAGVLFSLGHGVVVVGVALSVSLLASQWQPPPWLSSFGVWMSVVLLSLLALMNIGSVLRTPADQAATLVGWRSGVFARLLQTGSAPMMMGVGSLFALSFDTISQAALFAVTAAQFGGWQAALLLALTFTAGMLVADGTNGWFIAHLVRRSDQTARVASRAMALTVAGVGLLTAALGAANQTLPGVARWTEGKQLWFAATVLAIVFASYALGQHLARQRVPLAGASATLRRR